MNNSILSWTNRPASTQSWLILAFVLVSFTACGEGREPPSTVGTSKATAGDGPGQQRHLPLVQRANASPGSEPDGRTASGAPGAGRPPKAAAVIAPADAPAGPRRGPDKAPKDPYAYRDKALFPNAAMTVYLLLKSEGDSTASYLRIRRTLRGDLKGISFGHIKAFLGHSGIKAEARREPLSALLESGRPAIILTRTRQSESDPASGRYVFCRGRESAGVVIVDPMVGRSVVKPDDLAKRCLGVNLRLEQALDIPAREAPDFFCEEFVWSFNEVASGAEVRHSFKVENRGTRPLRIDRVETTCGCAAAMVGKKGHLSAELMKGVKPEKEETKKLVVQKDSGGVIPPGENAWISAYVNTLHKQGYMAFRIRVRSNDPEEPDFDLTLQGNIVRVFEHDPVTIWFQQVKSTSGDSAHLWVRHYQSKAFEIKDIKANSKYVRVEVDPDPPRVSPPPEQAPQNPGFLPRNHPADQGWVGLKVTLLPGAPIGPFSATISLKADDTPIEANVAALVKGNLVVEPGYFSFGHIRKGDPQKVTVKVHSELGAAFKIDKVEVDKGFMNTTLLPAGEGTYRVTLALKEGWSDYDLQGVVTIHSNDPLEGHKRVLVYGFIKR